MRRTPILLSAAAALALAASPNLALADTTATRPNDLRGELGSTLSVSDVSAQHGLSVTPAVVQPGWVWQDGAWRWRLASGDYAVGWRLDQGKWYYLGAVGGDGAMRTGWQFIDGAWYLFNASGVMQTGWQYVSGEWYYLGDNGAMRVGWFWDGGWYYASSSGTMCRWWLFDGAWYYLGHEGLMRTGWTYINDAWYFLGSSGAMQTGWVLDGDSWYHTRPSGAMQTGWQYLDGMWYYLGSSGVMERGTIDVDGVVFYLSMSGNLVNASTTAFDASGTTLAEMAELNWADESYLDIGGPDLGGILQFKDLSDINPEGITAAQIDNFIARNCQWSEAAYGCTSSLRGCGQSFIDAAYWYGVNVVYLVCHATIESAWGCSSLSRRTLWKDPDNPLDQGKVYYNYFGYGAYDSDPYNGGMRYAAEQGWTTPAAAIWGGAKSISDNWIHSTSRTPQITAYELRWDPHYTSATGYASWHQYATADEFALGIGDQIGWFYAQQNVEPLLNLVVPAYAA